jgi:hypothetical protein
MKKYLVVMGCLVLAACDPFKVTDPNDPNFDPMKFRFSDYNHNEEIEVFRKIFPVGTKKEFVDQVFVEAGNANMFQNKDNKNIWHYTPPEFVKGMGKASYKVIYDEDDKLLNIQSPSTAKYTYPDQVKYNGSVFYSGE